MKHNILKSRSLLFMLILCVLNSIAKCEHDLKLRPRTKLMGDGFESMKGMNKLITHMLSDLMTNEEFQSLNDFDQRQVVIFLVRTLVQDQSAIVNVYID
jgi:hypothetical protein